MHGRAGALTWSFLRALKLSKIYCIHAKSSCTQLLHDCSAFSIRQASLGCATVGMWCRPGIPDFNHSLLLTYILLCRRCLTSTSPSHSHSAASRSITACLGCHSRLSLSWHKLASASLLRSIAAVPLESAVRSNDACIPSPECVLSASLCAG